MCNITKVFSGSERELKMTTIYLNILIKISQSHNTSFLTIRTMILNWWTPCCSRYV